MQGNAAALGVWSPLRAYGRGVWGEGGPRKKTDLIDMGRRSVRFGVFSSFFPLLFLTWFLKGFFLDCRGVLEPQMGAKTSFWNVFCDIFLEGILESIFLCFFFKVRTLIFVRTAWVL